ncbi:hypothetical protein KV557_24575 [Kitasatospora aureofaciens]|uniref:hypothetical protein n=1 Tax=Kitasatospora aureofaciens TaxID=1894 RepID=UPI001C44A42E|nr:hypothetical protein [Kitasatospora aureofaciens]MBV6700240.1 hypothetical protein [Kitasatospora aureofaciens]
MGDVLPEHDGTGNGEQPEQEPAVEHRDETLVAAIDRLTEELREHSRALGRRTAAEYISVGGLVIEIIRLIWLS